LQELLSRPPPAGKAAKRVAMGGGPRKRAACQMRTRSAGTLRIRYSPYDRRKQRQLRRLFPLVRLVLAPGMTTKELSALPKAKPRFIEPMYARLVNALPEGSEWLYEVKFDGYRCLAGKARQGRDALV
jgi:hypothetical protein